MAYIISSGEILSGIILENDSMTATNGGIQIIPDFNVAGIQLIYLDFDGELTKYRNVDMDLEIDDVQVEHSNLTPERIAGIVASLNAEFSGQNVLFVTDRPKDTAYSTIFIGKTSAFDQYGQFAGLAETVDLGNRIKNDNAFVLLDAADSDNSIIATIGHEAGHLLGTLDHGGDGIARMATYKVYSVFSGDIVSGTVLYFDSMYVYDGGTANDIFVSHGGRVHVWDDSFVNNPWLIGGGPLYECALYVSSGGLVTGATVNSGGFIHVYNCGRANYTIVNWDGYLYVSSGGVANYVTIYGGGLTLSSGGVMNHTVLYGVDSKGITFGATNAFDIYGGLANGIEVNESALVRIYSGGTATDTTINSGGSMYVSSGGTANSTTVNSWGSMVVSSGGTATDIVWTPCEGHVYVFDGGYATFVSEYSGVYYGSDNKLLSNAVAMDGKGVGSSCEMNVMNGGVANNTTVNSRGSMVVFSGGMANSTTVSGGDMHICSSGTANSTTINSGGDMYVSSGGMATDTSVNGGMYVSSGGTANSTTVNDGSWMDIYSGGTANSTTVNSYGSMHVSSGGIANSTTVNDGGGMYVYSGGTATEIRESGGYVDVADGANVTFVANTFSGLVLSNAATIHSGTTANSTTVNYGGWVYVSSGGTANSTTVNNWGGLYVSSGGTANSTTVNSGGDLYVSSGGTATEITENGGYVGVKDGANVTFVANTFSGLVLSNAATIHSGTTANSTTVNGGDMHICSSGTANSTTVNYGGWVYVSSGGTANSTTVNNWGGLYVSSGGTATDTTVNGGYLYVSSGGKLTGQTIIASGGLAYADSGAILDFDISNLAPDAAARFNTLGLISGWSNAIFTLTVSGSQANGTYKLADGTSKFNKTISIVNTAGVELGTLTVGQAVRIGDADYTLNLNSGTLSVKVVSSVVPGWMFFEGDFNGDGKDMLAAQKNGSVTVYMNGEPWGLGVTLDSGWEVVGVGDFDGDKLDDFLRVNTEGYVVGEMSNGNGTFSPQVLNFLNDGWKILGTGDFNGNGSDDVLVANPTGASDTVGLLGYWESGVTWTLINGYSPEWECVSTGDFNGDGKCDMLWRNSFEGEGGLTYNAYCTWIVDPPTGETDWRMVSVANPDEWNFLCSGDFDGNGSHDIAMINGEGVVGIWGVNDGYLNSWSILSAVDTSSWTLAGVGDFNGDDTDDIAWASDSLNLAGYWQINDKQLTTWANIAAIS